jgi:GTPase SAR1 family protein
LEFADGIIKDIYKKKELEVNTFPIILVGNKMDLEEYREIAFEEGRKVADSFQDVGFFEVSAKNSTNIQESVFYLLERILVHKQILEISKLETPKQKNCELM